MQIPKEALVAQLRAEIATFKSRLHINKETRTRVTVARAGLRDGSGVKPEDQDKTDVETLPYVSGLSAIPNLIGALDAILFSQQVSCEANIVELDKGIAEREQALKQTSAQIVIPIPGTRS